MLIAVGLTVRLAEEGKMGIMGKSMDDVVNLLCQIQFGCGLKSMRRYDILYFCPELG